MKNSLNDKLPESFLHVIQAIVTTAEKLQIPIFVIGATVRDVLFANIKNVEIKRKTSDIDFGIAIEDWSRFELLKENLRKSEGFRIDNKISHRLLHSRKETEVKVDFVPFGGVEFEHGKVALPPDGRFVMNVQGFTEAYENSLAYELNGNTVVKLASLPCLVILKFIAYGDRPEERKKDLQDIWFLMKNYWTYLEENGEENRLYTDTNLMAEEDFDMRTVGARLLGRDMQKFLKEKTRSLILEYFSRENDEGLIALAQIVALEENILPEREKEVLESFRQLRKGFLEKFDD